MAELFFEFERFKAVHLRGISSRPTKNKEFS